MIGTITISKPYVETKKNSARLCAVVNYDGKNEIIWYEVDKRFSKYLCYERADAFLLALLPYAMAFDKNIEIDAPVSEKLYYQLVNYYMPALKKFSNYYDCIDINPKSLDSTNYVIENGVGTGFSGGVDSFYTVLKNINIKEKSYRLTHLTFFNVGANGSFGGEKANDTFNRRTEVFKEYSKQKKLKFLTVNSNVSEHAKMSYNYIHTFRSISAVLALQKIFSKYYYSSTATINDFGFNVVDSANYDFFSLKNFEVEGMNLYSVGNDCERIDKQKFICKFEDTYNLLNVCNKKSCNCSRCEKCIRTMAGFFCIGELDNYKNVFDTNYFYNNFSSCMALLIGKKFDGTAEGNIDAQLIKNIKQSGYHISASAYIKAIPIIIKSLVYKYSRKIKPIRRWYHKKMNKELGCNYKD